MSTKHVTSQDIAAGTDDSMLAHHNTKARLANQENATRLQHFALSRKLRRTKRRLLLSLVDENQQQLLQRQQKEFGVLEPQFARASSDGSSSMASSTSSSTSSYSSLECFE